MAMIRAEMFGFSEGWEDDPNELGGKRGKGKEVVYSTADHHKVNVPTRPEHVGVRLPWDDEQERELRDEQVRKGKGNGMTRL
jgi:hypothetical protein